MGINNWNKLISSKLKEAKIINQLGELNKKCLRLDLKHSIEVALRILIGKLFQSFGAANFES